MEGWMEDDGSFFTMCGTNLFDVSGLSVLVVVSMKVAMREKVTPSFDRFDRNCQFDIDDMTQKIFFYRDAVP